jgi:hypothetical protein
MACHDLAQDNPRGRREHRGVSVMNRQIIGLAYFAAIVGVLAWSPAAAQTPQQTKMRECAAEWMRLKAANKTEGQTFRGFQKDCLTKTTTAAPSPTAPTPATKPATTGQPSPSAAAPQVPSAVEKTRAAPAAANQFASEAEAKARCRTDTVVWVNLRTKVYHFGGTKRYGNTRTGAYMCEGETAAAGFRAAKHEKRP